MTTVALVGAVVTGGAACTARRVDSSVETTTRVETESTVGDDVLKARVEAVLLTAADVSGDRIAVFTTDGVVTLIGQVGNGFEQQSVGAIVRAVPGVDAVRFDLEVVDSQAGR